jgi:hypothetical protein
MLLLLYLACCEALMPQACEWPYKLRWLWTLLWFWIWFSVQAAWARAKCRQTPDGWF